MTDLFWPGDDRAGDLFSDASFLAAMVAVEAAWLDALVGTGIAPPARREQDLAGLVDRRRTPDWLARERRGVGGNPVMPLVALLRDGSPSAARTPRGGCTAG